MIDRNEQAIISELAAQYNEAVNSAENARRVALIRAHNEKRTREMPMIGELGMWNYWVRQMILPQILTTTPEARDAESYFRFWLYMFYEAGDDRPLKPYYSIDVELTGMPIFGVGSEQTNSEADGGAYHIDPVILNDDDFDKIKKPALSIDEYATRIKREKVMELVNGNVAVDLCRGPFLRGFTADLSQQLGYLMGIENFMLFPHMYSEQMHRLLSRMRDGVLETLKKNEKDGNVSRSATFNQSEPYFDDIPDPRANENGVGLNTLAAFFAAQEYTGVSPRQFEEFLFRYQKPIMELFAHITYGCCENLTDKIDILRTLENLHTIAVTPSADVERCAKQIGEDYIVSWRPNPTDTVSAEFNEEKIRNLLKRYMESLNGCYAHLMLKDVETVGGDPGRIKSFFDMARDEFIKIN